MCVSARETACSAPPAGTTGETTTSTDTCSVDVYTVSISQKKKNPQSLPQQRLLTCREEPMNRPQTERNHTPQTCQSMGMRVAERQTHRWASWQRRRCFAGGVTWVGLELAGGRQAAQVLEGSGQGQVVGLRGRGQDVVRPLGSLYRRQGELLHREADRGRAGAGTDVTEASLTAGNRQLTLARTSARLINCC